MKLIRDSVTSDPLTYNDGNDWKLADKRDSLLIPAGSKLVTVGDLKDQIGTSGQRPLLLCQHCGNQSSANAGDYWNAPKDHVFVCCEAPMMLGFIKTVFEPCNA